MDSPIMFKTAISGFDKKAVISYIFELNESSQAAQKRLTEQLEEVNQAREALDQQLAESQKKMQRIQSGMDNLSAELEGEKARTGELTEMVENLNLELDRQKQLVVQKEYEAKGTGELQERLAQLEVKKLEVEKASAQIGRLLLDASADADRMRTEAQTEVEELMNKARLESQNVIDTAGREANSITAAARAKASDIVGEAKDSLQGAHSQFVQFRKEMDTIQQAILNAVGDMQSKTSSIRSIIDTAQHNLNIDIDMGLEQIDIGFSVESGSDEDADDQESEGQDGFFRFAADS